MRYLVGLCFVLFLGACSTAPVTGPFPAALNPLPYAEAGPQNTVFRASLPENPSRNTSRPKVKLEPMDPAVAAAMADSPLINIDQQRVADMNAPDQDLWGRIRNGFAMGDLQGPLVEDRTQWYASRPDYVERMVERSNRYLFHIVEELERRKMPTELALLPFIESAFNPQAYSVAKAAGMWQFIPSTGQDYNLRQNVFIDERRDVLASTEAALDYLQRLYAMFGDWHLALAAYNWGEGSVQRAINRNEKAGLPTDYASLRMPSETQYYVPKLQAIKNIIANPQGFGIVLQPIANHPYFLTVTTSRDIDVELAAKLAELPLSEFRALNPSFNRPVILGATNPQILLPFESAEIFQNNLIRHRGSLSSWAAVTLGKKENAESISKRLGVDIATLREVNRIPKGMRLKAGSTILVPKSKAQQPDISPAVAENAVLAMEPDRPDMKRVYVKARKNDTVAKMANRYSVSVAELKSWNRLTANALPAGKKLVVMVPYGRSIAVASKIAVRKEKVKQVTSLSAKNKGVESKVRQTKVAAKPSKFNVALAERRVR